MQATRILALALLAVSAAVALPALNVITSTKDLQWMMIPDDNGKPTLAILNGPDTNSRAVNLPNDVQFHLYTRSNPVVSHRLFVGDVPSLDSSFFNKANPTKILIHGYTSSLSSGAIQELKDAYMATGPDYNVIGVDWAVLADGPLYNIAKQNTFVVGEYVGLFIDFLVSQGVTYESFHTSGHSLGGHVAGIAGDKASGTISRATGLDPALPLFANDDAEHRISSDDATYVDIIHTDGGNLGFMDPLGHADFYPNGGVHAQPGCGIADVTGSCSHSMCYKFYAATIMDPTGFDAHQCDTLVDAEAGSCGIISAGQMGEGSSPTMRGLFHLRVRL